LPILLPIELDDDLHAVGAEKIAERPEFLKRNAGSNAGSHCGDHLPPARVDGGLLAWPEDSAAGSPVAFADPLAIGIDVIPQPLGKVLPRGAGEALHIWQVRQSEVGPAGNLGHAGIPMPDQCPVV